jgi:hypothetical protein
MAAKAKRAGGTAPPAPNQFDQQWPQVVKDYYAKGGMKDAEFGRYFWDLVAATPDAEFGRATGEEQMRREQGKARDAAWWDGVKRGQGGGEADAAPPASPTVDRPAPKDRPAPVPRSGGAVLGFALTAVIRWLGANGHDKESARQCLARVGADAVNDSTLGVQLGKGRKGVEPPAPLTAEQARQLTGGKK